MTPVTAAPLTIQTAAASSQRARYTTQPQSPRSLDGAEALVPHTVGKEGGDHKQDHQPTDTAPRVLTMACDPTRQMVCREIPDGPP